MNKKYLFLVGTILAALTTACNEEPFSDGGEGKILLNATINSDMKVETRDAVQSNEELRENCMVWISNEKGLVRRYNSGSELPSEPISLISGHYIAEAWAGDSVPASFEQRWFKGYQEFDVQTNSTTQVKLECKIANVSVSVKYDENIPYVLKDFYMTVSHQGGSLLYKDDTADSRGYFMMPSFDKDLSWVLNGKQIDGSDFSLSGIIENAKPATEYVLNVKCTEKTNDVGGAVFKITVDKEEKEIEEEPINIITAPKIQGYGFDISKAIMSEKGQIGRMSVYVSSPLKLKNLLLESDELSKFMDYPDVDLVLMKENIKALLESHGISVISKSTEDEQTLIQVSLEEGLTRNWDNGTYIYKLTATDINGRTSVATLNFIISDALVLPGEVEESSISYNTARVWATVNRDDVESIGFNYRLKGTSEWSYIDGQVETRSFEKGTRYYADLTGLKSGNVYEYTAVSDDFVSQDIQEFSTKAHQQLPNASFEEWGTYQNKIIVPTLSYEKNYNSATTFWDTGNHGSSTLNKNITNKSTAYVHDGNYSAYLKSEYVVVKLAAGNIFAGQYVATSGTDGVTGFGRPFTDTPKSVKLWVKYEPGTGSGNYKKKNTNFLKDGHDEGQIFIALTDDTKEKYSATEEWPIIVNTGTQTYFSDPKYQSRIIAYGEKIFTEATEGDGLIEIEIPIEYYRDETPSNIIFVASSSRYGDYFEGYDGSTMYLDDIKLIYEE